MRVHGLFVWLGLASISIPATGSATPPLDTLHRHGFESCSLDPQRLNFSGANGDAIEGWFWRSGCAQENLAPAVVMLHGCSGVYATNGYGGAGNVSSRFVRWARELNDLGMHALLVDSFSTRDPDDPPATSRQDYCNARADIVAIGATEEQDRPRDAIGAYGKLMTLVDDVGEPLVDPERAGLTGWSHGGSAALATVARDYLPWQPFRTAQIFYPGCGLYDAFGNPGSGTSTYVADVPTQLHIGTADTLSSVAACSAHGAHSDAAGGSTMTVTAWPSAMHSFDGASCVRNDQGALVSPWTGLRWDCAGTYDGMPFSLHDWFARTNSARRSTCELLAQLVGREPDTCAASPWYP